MTRYFYYLAIWMAAVLATGYPAQAGQCADRQIVVQRLAAVYGETLQAVDTGQSGLIVEVFAAKYTGSWTIIATGQAGQTCLIAAGQGFDWHQPWIAATRVAV